MEKEKLTLKELHKNKDLNDLEGEYWKEHPTYNNLLVSNLGRLKSKDKYVNNPSGKALRKSKIYAQTENKKGYLDSGITHEGKSRTIRVHRLVAETFLENPENKPQVNHKNGNKKDNNFNNLEWSTSLENVRHSWRTGLNKERTDLFVKEMVGYVKGYLDHRIKVSTPLGIGEIQIDSTCFRIIYENGKIENLVKSIRTWRSDFKLIVRELSDLTKEITHNGETFVPIEWFKQINSNIDFEKRLITLKQDIRFLNTIEFGIIQQLYEWHFDIHGLIERNLALNLNDLPNE